MVEIFNSQKLSIDSRHPIASDESDVFAGTHTQFGQVVLKAYHPPISLNQINTLQRLTAQAGRLFDGRRLFDFVWSINPILEYGLFQQHGLFKTAAISPFVKGSQIWNSSLHLKDPYLSNLLDAMTIELNDRLQSTIIHLVPSNIKVANVAHHLIITDLCSVVAGI